jgi:hypothetical protein
MESLEADFATVLADFGSALAITAERFQPDWDIPPVGPLLDGAGVPPVADWSTDALLALAQNGDARSWEELVARHNTLIWSIPRAYHLGPEEAAEVVEATWLRLARSIDTVGEEDLVPSLVRWARTESLVKGPPVNPLLRRLPLAGPQAEYDLLDMTKAMHDMANTNSLRLALRNVFRLLMLVGEPIEPAPEPLYEVGAAAFVTRGG